MLLSISSNKDPADYFCIFNEKMRLVRIPGDEFSVGTDPDTDGYRRRDKPSIPEIFGTSLDKIIVNGQPATTILPHNLRRYCRKCHGHKAFSRTDTGEYTDEEGHPYHPRPA